MRDFKFVATDTKRERHRFKVVDVETDKAVVHSVASYETPEEALEDYQAVYGWMARTSLLNRNAQAELQRLDTELQAALVSLAERDKTIAAQGRKKVSLKAEIAELTQDKTALEARITKRDAAIAERDEMLRTSMARRTKAEKERDWQRDERHKALAEHNARRRTLRYRLFGWLSG